METHIMFYQPTLSNSAQRY